MAKRECALGKIMCPGSETKEYCPRFDSKCPNQLGIQKAIGDHISVNIRMIGERANEIRKKIKGEP